MTKPNTPLPVEVEREFDERFVDSIESSDPCLDGGKYLLNCAPSDVKQFLATALDKQKGELVEKINNLDYQLAKDHDKLHRFGQFSERLVRRSDVLNLLNNS